MAKLDYHINEVVLEHLVGEFLFPLLYGACPRRKPRSPPNPKLVKNVLIWCIDSIGDAIWTIPSIKSIRIGYKDAKITLVCSHIVQELFQDQGFVDEVIAIHPEQYYRVRGYFKKVKELHGRNFDVTFILEMGSRPADRGRLLSREISTGYMVSSYLGLLKHLPDYTANENAGEKRKYWPEYFLSIVEHLGLPQFPPSLGLVSNSKTVDRVKEIIQYLDSKSTPGISWIGLHPCVAKYATLTKQWPKENFVELGVSILKNFAVRIVITGSSEEREECKAITDEIRRRSHSSNVLCLAGELSLVELAAFLKNLSLIVVGDTAVLHLAEAAGIPIVALFGATDPKLISSGRKNCVVLTEDLPCRPCHKSRDRSPFWPRCIYSEPLCLTTIAPERVLKSVEHLLGRDMAKE